MSPLEVAPTKILKLLVPPIFLRLLNNFYFSTYHTFKEKMHCFVHWRLYFTAQKLRKSITRRNQKKKSKKVESNDVSREILYWYTGMGAQILVPKKGNIPSLTIIFSITGLYFFILTPSKVNFHVRKRILSNSNNSEEWPSVFWRGATLVLYSPSKKHLLCR